MQEISIRGVHNLYNAMAATLAAQAAGIGAASLRATLKNFKGVEHRLEHVRELDGITYVNDSKATNVDSVWYALQSYTTPLVVLIGGRDKGNDYSASGGARAEALSGRSLPSANRRTRSLRHSRRSYRWQKAGTHARRRAAGACTRR